LTRSALKERPENAYEPNQGPSPYGTKRLPCHWNEIFPQLLIELTGGGGTRLVPGTEYRLLSDVDPEEKSVISDSVSSPS
jgi:hypothetical protein